MYMFNHQERVTQFGKKETSPAAALKKLYETDVEVAAIIDEYKESVSSTLAYIEMGGGALTDDRVLLEKHTSLALDALAEVGMTIDATVLEDFVATL